MEIKQYDLQYALQRYLREKTGMPADIVYDGYKLNESRPLITIEQMQNNLESISKLREGIQVIYRFQVGLHASNAVEKVKTQETISYALTFGDVPYFNTAQSIDDPVGFFVAKLNAVVPMPAEDITKRSSYHRVYFDVEVSAIKRRCI